MRRRRNRDARAITLADLRAAAERVLARGDLPRIETHRVQASVSVPPVHELEARITPADLKRKAP